MRRKQLAILFGLLLLSAPLLSFAQEEGDDGFNDDLEVDEGFEEEDYEVTPDDDSAETAQAGEQRQGITREQLEHLMTMVSDTCRAEMAESMQQNTPVSDTCREELRAAYFQTPEGQAAAQEYMQQQGTQQGPGATQPKHNKSAVLLGLGMFVLVLIGGVCGYVYYFQRKVAPTLPGKSNSQLKKEMGKKKPKKGARR